MGDRVRNDWTLKEVRDLAEVGLLELVFRAQVVHRQFHDPGEIQVCKLISVKTGACPEDCAYCAQSSRYETEVTPTGLMPREEVVRLHQSGEYTVFFLGFQPGFAYLGGMDRRLATARRKEPRLAVPAGSLAIGGEQTGIYPSASPGGWQLIGRTSVALFDPARDPPSLLLPGDSVRFVDIGAAR